MNGRRDGIALDKTDQGSPKARQRGSQMLAPDIAGRPTHHHPIISPTRADDKKTPPIRRSEVRDIGYILMGIAGMKPDPRTQMEIHGLGARPGTV